MSLKEMFWKKPEGSEEVPKLKAFNPPLPSATAIAAVMPQVDATSGSEFDQYLNKIMEDANLPGPDYYEFSKALASLKSAPLTDEQKYVTIFAGFQAQGVTPKALVDAAQKYIAILGQKKSSEFDPSVASAEVSITGKESLVKQLGEENIRLSQQIQDNATKITKATEEVTTLRSKLEIKKTTFNLSFQNFIKKIMDDVDNITKYLVNGQSTK